MDRVTRCLHCGKRMVPAPSPTGRTELVCVFCDKVDPMEMLDGPIAHSPPLFPRQPLKRASP
jgi:hypothetical protein